MKLLFITTFISLIIYISCYINNIFYIELPKGYLITSDGNDKCDKIYLCENDGYEWLGADHVFKNCYYRTMKVDDEDVPDNDNPNKCIEKRYAYVSSQECYWTSDGSGKPIATNIVDSHIEYFDIDIENRRVLTEWGWCTYLYDHVDANWMGLLDPYLKLNQVILPGTHDSGSFDIEHGIKIPFIGEYTAKTQMLDILEQLNLGIRYLDIRLKVIDNMLKIYHGILPCKKINGNIVSDLLLSDVINDCIIFLINHPSETIIIHLKKEENNDKDQDINNFISKIYNDSGFKEYFYIPEDNDKNYSNNNIPILKDVRGRIVFFSRTDFIYNPSFIKTNKDLVSKKSVGFLRKIDDNPDCNKFSWVKDCTARINNNFRYQDNYNIDKNNKWKYIEEMLTENSIFNRESKTLHTLTFMNIAFYNNFFYKSPILSTSTELNKKLYDLLKNITPPNEWYVLDFPSPEIVRKIYNSNKLKLKTESTIIDMEEIKEKVKTEIGYIVCILPNALYTLSTWINRIEGVTKIFQRNENDKTDEELNICLQRKIVIDEQGNQQDIVKFNYKCVNNNMNKWSIKSSDENGKYYSIISLYNYKCLNYDSQKDILYMQECKKIINTRNSLLKIMLYVHESMKLYV